MNEVQRKEIKKAAKQLYKALDILTEIAATALANDPGLTVKLGPVNRNIGEAFNRLNELYEGIS